MISITSCKLFRASTRKGKILAALGDPTNVELVTQLQSHLDEDSIVYSEPDNVPSNVSDEGVDDKSSGSSGGTSSGPSGGSSSPSSGGSPSSSGGGLPGMFTDEPEGSDVSDEAGEIDSSGSEPSDDSGSEPEPSDEGDPVDSATSAEGTTINAAYSALSENDIHLLPKRILPSLNSRDDTQGVERCNIQNENELWVYYNDKVNLNNIMTAVVEHLNAASYSCLQFNRLARTDNAIVFQVDIQTSQAVVAPIDKAKTKEQPGSLNG